MKAPEVESLVRMARAYAAECVPWFAPALFGARLVLSDAVPAMAGIDRGMRVYFNRQLIAQLSQSQGRRAALEQVAWVWVHEISHALRDHAARAEELHAEPLRWNVAADLEINDATWPGLNLPTSYGPLLPGNLGLPEGQLAEFYYKHVAGPGKPQKRRRRRVGTESRVVVSAVADEGAGVHGQPRPWELPEPDAVAVAVSPLDQDLIRERVADLIRNGEAGTIPAGWRRWADGTHQPRINWREQLRRRMRGLMVHGAGQRMDYGFQRPHRRAGLFAPFVRPALHGDFLPRVACVVDTSGSIAPADLAQSLAEVRGVLDSLRTPIVVIPCDTVAYEPIRVFTKSDFLRLSGQMRGGGGTDMVAGIDAALRLRPVPDVVIVLSDGYTPFPLHRYRPAVLFGILDTGYSSQVPKPPMPPWQAGDVVVIPARPEPESDRLT